VDRARFFHGDKLRLARLLAGMSLDELGGLVAASRQFVHQLETGAKEPTDEMRDALAAALAVTPTFFAAPAINPVREEDCHFPAGERPTRAGRASCGTGDGFGSACGRA